jgi:hypothetical protein
LFYDETFSPIVKAAIVRTMLTLVVSRGLNLNVKNAFLHGSLTKAVYWPTDFINPTQPQLVCQLNKSLYSLK